jgi:uncharacterized protein DUF6115
MTAASSLPLLACVLSGLALAVCAGSFLWLKRQVERLGQEPVRDAAAHSAVAELGAQIGQLRLRLEEVEQRKTPLSDWAAAEPSSVNLNRRGQVLRLYKRGDSVAHIASALGLSTGEVALIVKVQEMTPPGRGQENPASEL